MRNIIRRLSGREAGIFVMIILFCTAVGLYKPHFISTNSLRIILLLVPLIMIGAIAQMLVLVARHVDLSMGSMLGFSAMVAGLMYRDFPDIWWPVGFLVAIVHRGNRSPHSAHRSLRNRTTRSRDFYRALSDPRRRARSLGKYWSSPPVPC